MFGAGNSMNNSNNSITTISNNNSPFGSNTGGSAFGKPAFNSGSAFGS